MCIRDSVNTGKNPPDQVMYRSINFDQVPDPTLSWVGSGFFSQYTISNTGQSGVFEPPPGWDGYNGEFPVGYGAYNGRTGEFPSGTNQFYTWGAGLWIGGKSENFNTPEDRSITIGDTSPINGNIISSAEEAYDTHLQLWKSLLNNPYNYSSARYFHFGINLWF